MRFFVCIPKKALETQVLNATRDFGVGSILFRNAIGRNLDLNITDSVCLGVLSVRGVSTPTELASYTGLTTGATTAMLDRLEEAGFIRRKANPMDRRGVLIEIGKQYIKTIGPIIEVIQNANSELIASYTDRELEVISSFLTRFTNNLIDSTKSIKKDSATTYIKMIESAFNLPRDYLYV